MPDAVRAGGERVGGAGGAGRHGKKVPGRAPGPTRRRGQMSRSAQRKVTVTARDGQKVDFLVVDGDCESRFNMKSGGMKDVYFAPDMSYVVALYRDKLDATSLERLERLVGPYRRNIFEREGGSSYVELYRWPERIVDHEGRTGIVVPIFDSKFFFSGGALDGAEKMGDWFTSAKNFNRSVPPSEKGTLLGFLNVCQNLSRAVKRLHAAGLAHSDLSYKNCLVDPSTGSACVIDIDGLVVPGIFPPDVVGTRDFIAPEVMMTLGLRREDPAKRLPCAETDLHALAVLVYNLLLHRHPLRGSKVWDFEDDEIQESMEMGEKALFIEHPTDPTNRRKFDGSDDAFQPWIDTGRLPSSIMGRHLQELFLSAFVRNLHNPGGRPTADDWEDALARTRDLLVPCGNGSCVKGFHVVDGSPSRPVCPFCGTPYPHSSLVYLDLHSTRNGRDFLPERRRMTVYPDCYIYPRHASNENFPGGKPSGERKEALGYFALHNGRWFFANLRLPSVKDRDTGASVPPGSHMPLRDGQSLVLSERVGGRMAVVRMAYF
ncbi:MAG: kinase [Deltaproteobacteria bacterium]|jgi:serine/threonine protein kinase|nr:kinase [Deltaproteobacteria bacterium]